MKMSGQAAPRWRARTRYLAVPVAAVTGLLIAVPALAPAGANPAARASSARADRTGSPAVARAGLGPGDVLDLIPDGIKKAVLRYALGKVSDFALSQLGLSGLLADPTAAKLDELESQLKDIATDVQTLKGDVGLISVDLSKIGLNQYTDPLDRTVTNIKTLYSDFYEKALQDLADYVSLDLQARADHQTCDDVTDCVKARDLFNTIRGKFLDRFNLGDAGEFNRTIHDLLVPNSHGESAVIAFGLYLAKNGNGFLNANTSHAILNFYNYFANYEALAAWMKAQWETTVDTPAQFETFLNDQVTGFLNDEKAYLPPEQIPDSTVIELPADPAKRTDTTEGLPMWGVIPDPNYGLTNWLPDSVAKPGEGVPFRRDQMNTNPAYGAAFNNWDVPTRADIDRLLSAGKALNPAQTGKDFLQSLNPVWSAQIAQDLGATPYIWTKQGAGNPSWAHSPAIACQDFDATVMGYLTFAKLTDYEHTAVGPLTGPLSGFPAKYQNYNVPDIGVSHIDMNFTKATSTAAKTDACKAVLKADFAKNAAPDRATFIAIRTTTKNYLPGPTKQG